MLDEKLVGVRLLSVKKEPFLTNFPMHVFATSKRMQQAHIRQAREKLIHSSISGYSILFNDVLPSSYLAEVDPTTRQRSFGHIPMMWAWVAQILEGNASCSKALGMIQNWYQSSDLAAPTGTTSGYCQARSRMKESFLSQAASKINLNLKNTTSSSNLWHGHVVKSIDGSSVLLMDTPANQLKYPQHSSQKAGCGFPAMGVVALLNHSHGGWEGFETCNAKMRDTRVAPRMLKHLESEDILLADRAYCSYEFCSQLIEKGVHFVMRLHQARHRKLDWRKGKKISRNERMIYWPKPKQRPATTELSKEQWDTLPAEIALRYVRKPHVSRGGKKGWLVVVTNLLDHFKYQPNDMLDIYHERWQIELRLRDIKTILNMEMLAVKTPAMAHKTLWVMMIAYNLLKSQMQKAAGIAQVPVSQMSFKATLDLVTSGSETLKPLAHKPKKLKSHLRRMTDLCSQKLIDIRPGRKEPRATKRRPKSYQLLTKPRHIA